MSSSELQWLWLRGLEASREWEDGFIPAKGNGAVPRVYAVMGL